MKKLNLLLVALMFAGSVFFYNALPSTMPTHWNVRGQIDAYAPKAIAVWMLPVLTLVMAIMFKVVPLFDPKKDKYQLFKREWEIIQLGLIGFFTYLHFLIFYVSLNPDKEMLPGMFIGLGALFMLIGNYLSKIRQNYFLGIKIPWTLSSEDNWNKTHRYASWLFVAAGLATLLEAYVLWYAPVIIIGGIILAAFLPMVYSFLLFKKKAHLMKWVHLALAGLILIIVLLRFATPEDTWLCDQGQWVKHGQPSLPRPTTECR